MLLPTQLLLKCLLRQRSPAWGFPAANPKAKFISQGVRCLFLHDQLRSVNLLQVQPTYAFQVNAFFRSSRKDAHDFTKQFINPISNYHLHVYHILN